MGCFRDDLERDIRLYREGIKRNEDTRKYHKFLTDRERLVGEELLRRSILKSGLSIAWLDNLMEEWEKIHTQFRDSSVLAQQLTLGLRDVTASSFEWSDPLANQIIDDSSDL
ncbi:3514_t:CDS:2, partial [Ambispora gerdemannii]